MIVYNFVCEKLEPGNLTRSYPEPTHNFQSFYGVILNLSAYIKSTLFIKTISCLAACFSHVLLINVFPSGNVCSCCQTDFTYLHVCDNCVFLSVWSTLKTSTEVLLYNIICLRLSSWFTIIRRNPLKRYKLVISTSYNFVNHNYSKDCCKTSVSFEANVQHCKAIVPEFCKKNCAISSFKT